MLLSSRTDIKNLLRLLVAAVLLSTTSCNNNYLESFATKTDNDSLYWAAEAALATSDYNTAVTACTSMSSSYISEDNVAQICAGAFAGRCGYSLGWMITNLQTVVSNPPVFLKELNILNTVQTAQQAADCLSAEQILQGIGTAAVRSNDANMFMILLTFYEIGVVSSNMASNGSGALAGTFTNACTQMTAAQKQQVGMAFYDLYMSSQALSSVAFVSTLATAIQDECTELYDILPTPQDLCNLGNATVGTSGPDFNPNALSAQALKGAASILEEGFAIGLNAGCGGQPTATCSCP